MDAPHGRLRKNCKLKYIGEHLGTFTFSWSGWNLNNTLFQHISQSNHNFEEAGRKLHKNVESSIKQVLATTPHETPTIRTPAPHHENYTSSMNQTRRTLLEKQGWAHKRCTPVDPHIWMCKSGTTSTNIHTATMWGHRM